MFAHLHIFAFLAGGAIVVTIIAAMVGGYLEKSQPEATQEQKDFQGKVFTTISFILFIVLCMSVLPLFLRFFTHMQGLIGNGDLAMVKFIRQHERMITYVLWSIIVVVLLFMSPTMIREGGPIAGLEAKSGDATVNKR